MPHGIQRTRIKAIGERVIDQPARHPQHLRTVQVLRPVALQRAEVIGISELAPQLFKNLPIPVAGGGPVCLLEVLAQMGLHAIVVDERVVDIEQEDNIGRFGHRIPACFAGLQLFLLLPSRSLTTSVTRSASNPYFRSSSLSGAEAPNVFMPMTRPDLPT